MRRFGIVGVAVVLAAVGLGPGPTAAAERGDLVEPRPRYREVVTGGADPEARLPMIVVLHGRGGGAGHLRTQLAALDVPARVVLPQGPVRSDHGRPAWFVPRADDQAQEEVARAVGAAADDLGSLLESIHDQRPTCGKAIVVGWSQGGVLALALALERPELLSRAIAVAGTVPDGLVPTMLAPHVPIVVLHGIEDARVSFRHTRDVVDRLEHLGYAIELHRYRHDGHEPGAAMLREVRRQVTAEVKRLTAAGGCGRP